MSHEVDYDWKGFEWIDCNDYVESIVSFVRYNKAQDSAVLFACNFTPVPRYQYRIGVPWEGFWEEILNSDGRVYGGSGIGNFGGLKSDPVEQHGRASSISITLPPLGIVVFRCKKSTTEAQSTQSSEK